ncbi:MAG: hypothetical protein H5U06_03930 [Candidatus Aminicenantes bacterium]|nr:hypothetical protein [Candidatus Aminicenantes bacterium]
MKRKRLIRYFFCNLLLTGLLICLPINGQETSPPENNDFYDNEPFLKLPLPTIEISGEVLRTGPVNLKSLPLHQVQVREARMENNKAVFVGAYVYLGYSLFDILREQPLSKKNKEQFSSPIDLLVIIENKKGEKAIFSWGEIFYPTVLHRIIIAVRVAPIVPSSTRESWHLPETSKVVAANDLYSERNIEDPVRIIVRSCPLSLDFNKGRTPLFSEKIKFLKQGEEKGVIDDLPEAITSLTLPAVFFGRGQGFHGIKFFTGVPLRLVLNNFFPIGKDDLKAGYLVLVAADGYRAVFSISEVFNRNDCQEIILCDQGHRDGGRFSIFPAPDFFSDRAVKSLKEIYLFDR